MSFSKETTIWCDHNRDSGLAFPCNHHITYAGTLKPAREYARDDGWALIEGKDYCRAHKQFHQAKKETKT